MTDVVIDVIDLTEIKNKISAILLKKPHFFKIIAPFRQRVEIRKSHSTLRNKTFHPLEQNVPGLGTKCSTPWNKLLHPLEGTIPKSGTNACTPCDDATARNAVFQKWLFLAKNEHFF